MPANGERPHRFTELLLREEAWHDACETCERPVHLNEGPHVARRYQFVARGIAEAEPAGHALEHLRRALLHRVHGDDPNGRPAQGEEALDGRLGGRGGSRRRRRRRGRWPRPCPRSAASPLRGYEGLLPETDQV
ncbi:MAG: hypothetical protein LC790_02910 [Actinobacteria bacterium]|nr:hypothetical protein [Actinomycetota bacterium]